MGRDSNTNDSDRGTIREQAGSMRLAPAELLDGLDAIVWEMDPSTWRFTFASAGAERILGYPVEQWVADPDFWRTHLHPDDREAAMLSCASCVARGTDQQLEYRMMAADGRVVWLRDLVRTRDGTPGAGRMLHGVMFDITAQKAAEAERRQSEERFARFSNASVDGVVVHAQGRVTDANEAVARMLGYEPRELIGRPPTELTVPEERPRLVAHMFSGSEAPLEGTALARDGTRIPVEIRGRTVPDGDGIARVVIVRDIRERRRAEQAVRETELQLQQSQKLEAIGRLAGGIAHDFNNLLTVITGFTQMVREELAIDDPRSADLGEVQRAATRASELTRQLLAFSRKQLLQRTLLDAGAVVRDLDRMLQRLIGEHLQLRIELPPEPVTLSADRGQLEQVLMNLVVNARDAMPDGGTITIAVGLVEAGAGAAGPEQEAMPARRYVRLAVRDTGVGMSDEVRARAFEPFFTTKPAGMGTGLGLPMVHGIVTQSDGVVAIESTPGRGTTVTLDFPAVEDTAAVRVRALTPARARGTETILLVEDEEAVRDVARRMLTAHGYRVLAARHAAEALSLAIGHAGSIDLLVTDLVMPDLPGRALAERLATLRPGIPALFMSGYTDDDELQRSGPAVAPALLRKPFTVESLLASVRAMLDPAREAT